MLSVQASGWRAYRDDQNSCGREIVVTDQDLRAYFAENALVSSLVVSACSHDLRPWVLHTRSCVGLEPCRALP